MRKGKSSHGERIVKDIKHNTRKQYSAEEKIRIVLDGLRGEEGIAQGLYYKWSKAFLEAGRQHHPLGYVYRSQGISGGDT